jgi:transcriptional regulator with XRE-family HTH domain
MPSNTEGLPTNSCQEFCRALKAARERKGITLAQISTATKIPAYLFAALERNDLRRWPKGLFRRSFFRDYAKSVGLPVADLCAEFVRLFPDDGSPSAKPVEAPVDSEVSDEVRLALDLEWHGPRAPVVSRLLAAVSDGILVWLIAIAVAWTTSFDLYATVAVVTLAYFSIATVTVGQSPSRWFVSRPWLTLASLRQGLTTIGTGWSRAIGEMRHASGWLSKAPPEENVEASDDREWISDARRVGEPRLRVRIKVPH